MKLDKTHKKFIILVAVALALIIIIALISFGMMRKEPDPTTSQSESESKIQTEIGIPFDTHREVPKWLNDSDFNVEKIVGTGPKDTTGPHANWEYAQDPYEKLYIIDLGYYGDIEKVQIEWKNNNNREYRIDVATDYRSWYQAVNSRRFDSQIHEYEIIETYRRYIRIALNRQGSLEEIESVRILAVKSRPMPEVPVGPKTLGYPRPVIVPLPVSVEGVSEPVRSIGGTWKFTTNPPKRFWDNDIDYSRWSDIQVPGCSDAQGFQVKNMENLIEYHYPRKNIETVYKHRINIPDEYEGNRILIRFEAAYSYARIWVNGEMARIHRSGFTTFDTDITDYVIPGRDAIITVGLTAEVNTPEFPLARGLLGDVKLISLPQKHITRLHVETTFDNQFNNAILKVMGGMSLPDGKKEGTIKLKLKDADGKEIELAHTEINFTESQLDKEIKIPVINPRKWNAEEPYLYTLEAVVEDDGTVVQRVERKVGFREVKVDGNQLLVNGDPVKLRGVNWTNINPTAGLSANPEHDRESLLKLKAANVNFLRTAHFPQYDYFYELADELGFYVEAEVSVHLLTRYIQTHFERYEFKDDPRYTDWYLAQYAEMVEKDRSHPSIIYWSIGNESDWGYNFKQGRDYVKSVDKTRPVKFSWDTYVPSEYSDIRSIHYPFMSAYNRTPFRPTIYDEYAHLYTNKTRINIDPALRDIYGFKLQRNWEGIYKQDGGLGGAIWHSRDWFIHGSIGIWSFNPKWGLLDTWNREKPEYYHARKVYSPVKIREDRVYENPGAGESLLLPVENRYNHINLDHLMVEWSVGEDKGLLRGPDIPPHTEGNIFIPARNWADGDRLFIRFIRPYDFIKDFVVDEYEFVIGGENPFVFPGAMGSAPNIQEDEKEIKINGENFEIIFNKGTGRIMSGSYDGETIVIDGPDINLGIDNIPSGWSLKSIDTTKEGNEALVTIKGRYSTFDNVSFEIRVDGTGRIEINYGMDLPHSHFDELGVSLKLTSDINRISWKRKPNLWTVYPDDHIGRLSGTAYRHRGEGEETYGVKPEWSWSLDEKDFSLSQLQGTWSGTRDFRASKYDYYYATVLTEPGYGIRAESDGRGSVRTTPQRNGSVQMDINNEWGSTGVGEFKRYDIPLSDKSGRYNGRVIFRLLAEE